MICTKRYCAFLFKPHLGEYFTGDRPLRDDQVPGLLSAEEWDRRAERILAESAYDTALGKAMARDALRVTAGEMSETAFHRKYHEDVLEEFGVDKRPTDPGDDDE